MLSLYYILTHSLSQTQITNLGHANKSSVLKYKKHHVKAQAQLNKSLRIPPVTAVDIFAEELWKVSKMLSSLVDCGGSSIKITTTHAVVDHWPCRHTVHCPILA